VRGLGSFLILFSHQSNLLVSRVIRDSIPLAGKP
jgi:hypothetical protein